MCVFSLMNCHYKDRYPYCRHIVEQYYIIAYIPFFSFLLNARLSCSSFIVSECRIVKNCEETFVLLYLIYIYTNDSRTVCMYVCVCVSYAYTYIYMYTIGLILSFNISPGCVPLLFIYKACDMMKLSRRSMTVSCTSVEL